MTDDIVTRLRDIASLRGNMSGNVIPLACTEAADEIERLRAEVDSKDSVAYNELNRLYVLRGNEIQTLKDEIRELENACRSLTKARDRAIRALTEALRGD